MAFKLGFLKQKGGCGASTHAQMVLREYVANDWDTMLADLDAGQETSLAWNQWRKDAGKSTLDVQNFSRLDQALEKEDDYDLIIFDGSPRATALTLRVAEVCDLIVISTGLSRKDLVPQIMIAHELVQRGIPQNRICFVLFRTGESQVEIAEAREYIEEGGYLVLGPHLPDRTGYRRAGDEGLCATETRYSSLNKIARAVTQAIMDQFEKSVGLQKS
ncbi:hypothetical protein JYT20_00135 [Rhodothermus sp. AH-315-K08]|nr:hypothetical protein [Rhodothermus sp. AH-315-K08]